MLCNGSSRIVNIIESVHRVLFLGDPLPPSQKSTLKMLIFNYSYENAVHHNNYIKAKR